MAQSGCISILVLDGRPVIRRGICLELDSEPDLSVVSIAENFEAARERASVSHPDVVVAAIGTAVGTGLRTCETLIAQGSASVVVVSAHNWDACVWKAWKIGASAFVPEQGDPLELVRSVRNAASRQASFSPAQVTRALEWERKVGSTLARLTVREIQVLELMVRQETTRQIAAQLVVSIKTIEYHLAKIFLTLGMRSRRDAAAWASATHAFECGWGPRQEDPLHTPHTFHQNSLGTVESFQTDFKLRDQGNRPRPCLDSGLPGRTHHTALSERQ